MVGLLRGCLGLIGAFFFSIVLGIASGREIGGWWGALAGIGTFVVLMWIVAKIAGASKTTITVFDCLIPLIISITAGAVFFPMKLVAGGELFSPVTCIGSGLFLCVGLWLTRIGRMNEWALLFPFATFLYEILPINLPMGGLDDFLSLGGSGISLWLGHVKNAVLCGTDGQEESFSEEISAQLIEDADIVRNSDFDMVDTVVNKVSRHFESRVTEKLKGAADRIVDEAASAMGLDEDESPQKRVRRRRCRECGLLIESAVRKSCPSCGASIKKRASARG